MEAKDVQSDIRKLSDIEITDPFLYVKEIQSSLKALNRMAKRPSVDVEFEDLTYTVRNKTGGGKRAILKSVSGTFRSGELTAIIGPSGAGKSSLMNILVGYTSSNVTGNILVNGRPRDMRLYHKLSSYIMQDDDVQPWITVQEAMEVAANLKLGTELGRQEKLLVVDEVLSTLGLAICKNTRTENLSGGQKRRLAVALELVNNPPIIYLDEPTSGLDFVAIKQCISLLKILANCGRTIICTIHQPSASVFSLFDNVYIIGRGKCVYQGAPSLLVPFLSKCGCHCPTTHNPADFVLETIHTDGANTKILSNAILNGKKHNCDADNATVINAKKRKNSRHQSVAEEIATVKQIGTGYPTSFLTQFKIVLRRMMLQKFRNTTSLWIQLGHHAVSGILLGGIFFDIGNDGSRPIANFKYCLSILVFFMYTYVMIPILLYPAELKNLQREYFNRWYGLNAYYSALMIAGLPSIIILGTVCMTVSYLMSGQLLELDRFILFNIAGMMTALCSEGFGFAVASIFNAQSGAILGPAIVAPSLALSVYGTGFGPYIETVMLVLMRMSYLRYGIVGLATSLYSGRGLMSCEQLYCHHSDPAIFMRDLGMRDANYATEMLGLLGFTVFYRILAYVSLKSRLQSEFSTKILDYFSHFLRRKR